MTYPDKKFHDSLYDLETPLGGKVSFEEVMSRRAKSRKGGYLTPVLVTVSALLVATFAGVFWLGSSNSSAFKGNQIAANSNTSAASNASAESNLSISSNGEVNASDASESAAEKGTASDVEQSNYFGYNQNSGTTKQRNVLGKYRSSQRIVSVVPVAASEAELADRETITLGKTAEYIDASEFDESILALNGVGLNFVEIDPVLRAIYPFWLDIIKEKDPMNPGLTYFAELGITTGGSRYKNYQSDQPFSVRGNHYFSQYHALALTPVGQGLQVGSGFSYAEYAGNADWRAVSNKTIQKIDTQIITVIQPGLPNKYITVYDTTDKQVSTVENGTASYRLNRIGVPLAVRYYLGSGKTLFRIAATVTPGILISNSGQIFNATSMQKMDAKSQSIFTLDAQLGAGMYYNVSKRVAVIAEPNIFWQKTGGKDWAAYNRTGASLTVGLIIKAN